MIHFHIGLIVLGVLGLGAFMGVLWLGDAFNALVERFYGWQKTRNVSVAAQAQRASAGMGLALLTFIVVLLATNIAMSLI